MSARSSRSWQRDLVRVCALVLPLSAQCQRERRRFEDYSKVKPPIASAATKLRQAVPERYDIAAKNPLEHNAWGVSEGKRLFTWYNCAGCHAHGGGGMGPPLMDAQWIYGSEPAKIFATIVQGRPGGMPSFRGKIPDFQVWQLVAYVRSMSGQLRLDIEPGRSDSMAVKPPESMERWEHPRPAQPPHPGVHP